MHFKDFTDQFYQYPHHLSYSQLLRNHRESFASFDKNPIEENLKKGKEIRTVPRSTSKRRFNGKMLKNVFTQLKNKTSTELEDFINPNIPETSGFSNSNTTTRFETYNLNVSNGGIGTASVVFSESTEIIEKKNSPQVCIDGNSQEFEHIEKSIRYVVCPKKRIKNVPVDETQQKFDLDLNAQTSSALKIKNGPELSEGRVVDVYNVLKRVISNVKWKCKKCRVPTSPPQTVDTATETTIVDKVEKKARIANNDPINGCNCNKNKTLKEEANCTCWSKEDETLFCLLKLEARENFKQIKHIENELKLQKKALKFLNNRCKSLENIVKSKGSEKRLSRNSAETDVREIFFKTEKEDNTKLDDNEEKDDTLYLSFEEKVPETKSFPAAPSEEHSGEKSKIETVFNEDKQTHTDSEMKETTGTTKEGLETDPKPESRKIILKSRSQSVSGSKIKITISRSTVVINTSTDESTNSNQKNIACECIPESTKKDNEDCGCPSKKSSFVLKLFRKQNCDSKCKCCTTPKANKKKCRYFMEKKNKGKNKPSSKPQ